MILARPLKAQGPRQKPILPIPKTASAPIHFFVGPKNVVRPRHSA
jgi:hypothetical protein